MSDLAAALQIAIKVHAGQVDQQGDPYLLHVLRVVEAVESERAKVLAALHGVDEDGPNFIDLEDWEAFPETAMFIANSLEVLTRGPNETYAEYIESIADGHSSTWVAEVREVKIADLRDNLGRIPTGCIGTDNTPVEETHWASLKDRYEKALAALERVS